MGEIRGLTAMHFAHFLQTHNVGIKLLYRVTQVMDLQAPCRPYALHTLVNVVGCYTDPCHVTPRAEILACAAKRGICNIASALEGEKQRSAAS